MESKNYTVFTKAGEKNIVYLEGVNKNGTVNADEPNHFNDLRLVFGFNSLDEPEILGAWEATTEPGYYYTDNPMNPNGAARIAFGQYKAWQVGIHGNSEPHEALIQVGLVNVHRDYNRDMIRTGDAIDKGFFGINQHHGYDHPVNDIYTASAGCLVGRTRREHENFMRIIKQDVRYLKSREFIFTTTILDGGKI
ncbi:MAG: hypothetical protein CUR32_01215 [Flavobacterium sp.]|nr:MAG: hypothetical protein CUR32_01215 [Flavobacterium sp.] [Flavobacterium sp. FEMGT703F]